ncbi:hypothetical protein Tco_0870396, partial [Tanacetum coccineum]
PDIEIDYSQFTYSPKQSQPSKSETQTSDFDTCESDCSVETHESLPELTVNEPIVVSQPKVWSDAPIIEEYESDSEDEHVSLPTEEHETPSFTNQQVKTPRETVKNQFTHSKNSKVDKKGLGYGFTTKACFICGSFSHLIRDCDFHEKRMAKQAELNNKMRKKSTVLTRTGKILVSTARASGTNNVSTARASGTNNVSTARHNFNSQAVLTNAARKISTVKPFMNRVRPKSVFHKTYSPFRRPFNNTTALRTNFSKQKVNTAEENAVSAVGGKRETAVKPSADKQLMNVPVPLDHFPVNALTSKVFSFMVKKGKHFSGKVTPLFASMLVQPTEDEGATSERPSEPQPTPSPPHPSEANVEPQSDPSPRPSPSTHIPDSIPESSGGNHGGQSSSDKSLLGNEGDMTLQSVYDLCISLCTQVTDQAKEIKHLKAQIKKLQKKAKPVITHHRAWMKSGRKSAKVEPSVHKDPLFDELPDDTLDYIDAKDAQDVGRTRDVVNEEKETADDKVSTKDALSTAKKNEGTDDRTEGRSATPTTELQHYSLQCLEMMKTIAQFYLNMSQAKAVSREKEKGVELKDVEETGRPGPTSTRSLLTLKPLPKIDPKDKGKKKIEEEDESDTESKGIPEAEKKFKQLARDEEMARKIQEDREAEEDYDFIQARIEADRLLALRLQHEEREKFTIEERAKFLHDTIAAQRRFPLRDERRIKEMNKGVKDPDQKSLKKRVVEETPKKEDTAKVPAKVDMTEQGTKKRKGGHMKMLARKRKRSQSDVDSDDEHRKCLKIVTFEVMEQYSKITLEGIELILWGDLKIMMESSQKENDQSNFWDDQQE